MIILAHNLALFHCKRGILCNYVSGNIVIDSNGALFTKTYVEKSTLISRKISFFRMLPNCVDLIWKEIRRISTLLSLHLLPMIKILSYSSPMRLPTLTLIYKQTNVLYVNPIPMIRNKVAVYVHYYTVWKFSNFSATLILREINFVESRI